MWKARKKEFYVVQGNKPERPLGMTWPMKTAVAIIPTIGTFAIDKKCVRSFKFPV